MGLGDDFEMPVLSEEQEEIIETPVEDLPDEQVFVYVPLVKRLTTDIE